MPVTKTTNDKIKSVVLPNSSIISQAIGTETREAQVPGAKGKLPIPPNVDINVTIFRVTIK